MGAEYLAANVRLLRFVGVWNDYPDGSLARRAYHLLTAFVACAFVLHLCTQFAFPFSHIDDPGDALEGFNLTTVYVVTFLKMLTLLRRRAEVAALMRGLERSGGGAEAGILAEGDRHADRLTRWFSALTALGTGFFFLHAALTVAPTVAPCSAGNRSVDEHCLDPDRNLVYPAEFPFDTAGDSLGHVGALVFQLVGPGLFGNAVNLAADMLLVSVLIHLRARFRALGHLLRQLDPGLGHRRLCECVRRHQELYRLSATVGDIFSPLLFMQCFFSSLSYCIILFHLTMVSMSVPTFPLGSASNKLKKFEVSDDGVHLLKNGLFLLTHMGQLLLFCWFGTQIYEESLSVMHAAFSTPWMDGSPGFQSGVLAVILRAQRPVLLSGFHVYVVNLETFTSMLSSAFSYYTLLRKMYAEDFF